MGVIWRGSEKITLSLTPVLSWEIKQAKPVDSIGFLLESGAKEGAIDSINRFKHVRMFWVNWIRASSKTNLC